MCQRLHYLLSGITYLPLYWTSTPVIFSLFHPMAHITNFLNSAADQKLYVFANMTENRYAFESFTPDGTYIRYYNFCI